jgi:phosphohistidine phosphatase SixA
MMHSPKLPRTIMVVALWALALAAPGSAGAADEKAKAAETPSAEVPDWRQVPDLAARLKRGGMVVYFRHAATDREQKDQRPVDIADCAKQRNLSEKGRRQSQAIGEAFRAMAIRVGPVVTSPFCRTVDTARLAFGNVEKSDMLFFAIGATAADKAKAAAWLRRMLSDPPPTGENRIIVSHTANLKDAAGIWPKPEGVAIVFEPRGNGAFRPVARVEADHWADIVGRSRQTN